MQYRKLGRSDLSCSIVGLGTGRLTSFSSGISRQDALRLVHAAADHGVNVIDTADIYGQGDSEVLVGRAVRSRRHKFVVMSKVGYTFARAGRIAIMVKPILKPIIRRMAGARKLASTMRRNAAATNTLQQDFSPRYILRALDASLSRLQTDYLDVLFLHDPPVAVLESNEILPTLERARDAGKIRHIGICTLDPDVLALAVGLRDRLSVVQTPINPKLPSSAWDALSSLSTSGVGVVAHHIFANASDPDARLVEVCRRTGLDPRQALLGFVLRKPAVTTALIGTVNPAHLLQNIETAALISDLTFEELLP